MGGWPVRVVLLCAVAQLFNGYGIVSLSIAVPALASAWTLPGTAFSGVFAAGNLGIVAGALVAGPAGDRLGFRKALIGSMVFLAGSSLACALATSVTGLVVWRCLTGIGIGGIIPLTCALTADCMPDRLRAPIVMAICICDPVGGFLGGQIIARMIPDIDWRVIFWLGGLPPLVLMLALLFWLPESREATAASNPVIGLFRDGLATVTAAVWVFYFAIYLGLSLISYWLPVVLAQSGQTPAVSGRASSLISAATIASAIALVPFCWRFGPRLVLAVILPAGALAIPVAVLVHLNRDALLIAVFLMRLCIIGGITGGNGMTAALYPSGLRATAIGWALASGRIGVIGGPYFGSALLYSGWPPLWIFLCAGLCGLIGTVCVGILHILERRSEGYRI